MSLTLRQRLKAAVQAAPSPEPRVDCVHGQIIRGGACPARTMVHCDLMDLTVTLSHCVTVCTKREPKTDATTPATRRSLLLKCGLSPGDVMVMTAAVRDLHLAHPGEFETAVETTCAAVWEHNPHVVEASADAETIDMHYPSINQSNARPRHFIEGYHEYLEAVLGVKVPITAFRPDIYLSDEERGWMPQVQEERGHKGPYWVVFAGGKQDFTAKWWPTQYYQQVVDHFRGRVSFVQVGEKDHHHPELKNVIGMVGKTDMRQLIRMIHHADGVLCPVTCGMHLAAGVPWHREGLQPCVVIAGGREPAQWEAYPGHQFLHTVGALPCAATGGCWRSRCQKVGDGDEKDRKGLCTHPVSVGAGMVVPKCMDMIRPHDVVRAIERYYEGGVLEYA